jgi:hypothetical protein
MAANFPLGGNVPFGPLTKRPVLGMVWHSFFFPNFLAVCRIASENYVIGFVIIMLVSSANKIVFDGSAVIFV